MLVAVQPRGVGSWSTPASRSSRKRRGVDGRCMAEHGDNRVGGHEAMTAQRSEFADGRAVARHDERSRPDRGERMISPLSLRSSRCSDRSTHDQTVAPRATDSQRTDPIGRSVAVRPSTNRSRSDTWFTCVSPLQYSPILREERRRGPRLLSTSVDNAHHLLNTRRSKSRPSRPVESTSPRADRCVLQRPPPYRFTRSESVLRSSASRLTRAQAGDSDPQTSATLTPRRSAAARTKTTTASSACLQRSSLDHQAVSSGSAPAAIMTAPCTRWRRFE